MWTEPLPCLLQQQTGSGLLERQAMHLLPVGDQQDADHVELAGLVDRKKTAVCSRTRNHQTHGLWPLSLAPDRWLSAHASLWCAKYFFGHGLLKRLLVSPARRRNQVYHCFSRWQRFLRVETLCFGLRNAFSFFERQISDVLTGLLWVNVFLYLDDVVIRTATVEEHLEIFGANF